MQAKITTTFLSKFRWVLGSCLIIILFLWAWREGSVVRNLDVATLTYTTLISLPIVYLNAVILVIITRAYRASITLWESLFLTAVGTLGNALGGIPLGTGIKFIILVRDHKLRLAQVVQGYLFYSAVNAFWMIFVMAVTVWFISLPLIVKILPTLIVFVAVAVLLYLLLSDQRLLPHIISDIGPLLSRRYLYMGLIASCLNAAMMLLCYQVVIEHYHPQLEITKALFVVSTGLAVGFLSGFPSLGGVQELLLGGAGLLADVNALSAIEFGLFIRIASAIAGIIVLIMTFTCKRSLLWGIYKQGL